MAERKWIDFHDCGVSPSLKTRKWSVQTTDATEPVITLGFVKWFGRWRKYAFFPEPEMVFEQTCLRDIATFCESQTAEHRKTRSHADA